MSDQELNHLLLKAVISKLPEKDRKQLEEIAGRIRKEVMTATPDGLPIGTIAFGLVASEVAKETAKVRDAFNKEIERLKEEATK